VKRLLLVRHASTSATRSAAFPRDEALDDLGRRAAAALRDLVPDADELACSPALRCRQTAEAAGLRPRLDERLSECDFGRWAGASLAELDPADTEAWLSDPDAAPHGGETLRGFAARVATWLEEQSSGSTTVITHAGVIRAAVVHALAAPLTAFWRIDVAPLSITELRGYDGTWTLARLGQPVPA
jgi:broad specificity phosphatase PhoE